MSHRSQTLATEASEDREAPTATALEHELATQIADAERELAALGTRKTELGRVLATKPWDDHGVEYQAELHTLTAKEIALRALMPDLRRQHRDAAVAAKREREAPHRAALSDARDNYFAECDRYDSAVQQLRTTASAMLERGRELGHLAERAGLDESGALAPPHGPVLWSVCCALQNVVPDAVPPGFCPQPLARGLASGERDRIARLLGGAT